LKVCVEMVEVARVKCKHERVHWRIAPGLHDALSYISLESNWVMVANDVGAVLNPQQSVVRGDGARANAFCAFGP
jgi:hypothetical protein